MIEVAPNLFVGNQLDYEKNVFSREADGPKAGWAVVHACKEPYHRQALGYTGRGAPKDNPEYLFAFRENRLCLNLVDVDNADYVSATLMDVALLFIKANLAEGKKVLVHCNQGQSRGPSIALLYLAANGDPRFRNVDPVVAMSDFGEVYQPYQPAPGMAGYLTRNWPWKEAA